MAFVHQPLIAQIRRIRLLKIIAPISPSEFWGPLSCEIKTVNMESAPPYFALSYTWGDLGDPTYIIHINGGAYRVKKNLYHFLCYFRGDSRYHGTYLWIDQICINQSDLDERSYTVRFMPTIYWRSTCVITWLGIDTDTVAAALDFAATRSADALTVLLSNRYFTRLWIVQEVLLAREVHVLAGTVWLGFQDMEETAREQVDKMLYGVRNPSLYLLWDSIHNRQSRHLAQCIDRYSSNHCEKPQDRVYSLLGLVKPEEQLAIDYEKSVPEVFVDAVKVLARSHWRQHPYTRFSKEPPYITTFMSLAKNMGFAQQLDTLRKLTKEIYNTKPSAAWYQKVLQYLESSYGASYSHITDDDYDEEEEVQEEEEDGGYQYLSI
ncbi:HET-domain-containing protein [Cucurbitaria berberidis CBS 394.84]|uniref:HET-domain-containing protein n=1 Tax=Cucurbitaria berberidis CBS 394.84 TaxID=1168544 RepID=A0A9P4L8F1_9PLEO|nr:HET-domain-containing protein [Cucurbitaria berberidis CBS 394.84]KAF1846021.1 HET-domain-containing protein [Cucurbitaria berberidis CBS 394.84]